MTATAKPRPMWRIVLITSAICAVTAHVATAPAPLRVPVVLWFIVVCPGMACVRVLGLGTGDRVAEGTLAVAISISIAALSSEVLAIAGLWSPTGLLGGLAGLTVAGAALPARSGARRDFHSEEAEEAREAHP